MAAQAASIRRRARRQMASASRSKAPIAIGQKHFLLVPQIPDLEDYMKLMLDSFFRTARTLDLEIEKCRLQECER